MYHQRPEKLTLFGAFMKYSKVKKLNKYGLNIFYLSFGKYRKNYIMQVSNKALTKSLPAVICCFLKEKKTLWIRQKSLFILSQKLLKLIRLNPICGVATVVLLFQKKIFQQIVSKIITVIISFRVYDFREIIC